MTDDIINRDPEILGGTPVFAGTRVPIKAIFDYLEAGDDLDESIDDFPSVTREQAIGLLDLARGPTLVSRTRSAQGAADPVACHAGCCTQPARQLPAPLTLALGLHIWDHRRH